MSWRNPNDMEQSRKARHRALSTYGAPVVGLCRYGRRKLRPHKIQPYRRPRKGGGQAQNPH